MNKYPYRINVGFLINAPVGTSRDFMIEEPAMDLDEDLPAENIHCVVSVSKAQQGIMATVDCSCEVDLQCMRCLEDFHTTLGSHFEELFFFPHLRGLEEAELFLPESGYIDLQELIRQYLVMEIPYAPVCKEDCKGLCPYCGNNLNLGPCYHPEEEESEAEES